MRQVQIASVFLLTLWLMGCATVSDNNDFATVLAQTTYEVTQAADAIADAADAGIISRESDNYRTVKLALENAATYLELAWHYYADGDLTQAAGARQAALAAYLPMREYLLKLQEAQ